MSRSAYCAGCGRWTRVTASPSGRMLCAACAGEPSVVSAGIEPAEPNRSSRPPPKGRRSTSSLLGLALFVAIGVGAAQFLRHPPAGSVAAEPPLGEAVQPARPLTIALSDADYPPAAQRAGEQGTVRVRLIIRASGSVERCLVGESSGSPALDAATCAGLKRGTFSPALGGDGQPVRSEINLPITWRLPE